MAAKMKLDKVMEKVKALQVFELHITDNQSRKYAWVELDKRDRISETVKSIIDDYKALRKKQVGVKKSMKKTAFSNFTMDFFTILVKNFASSPINVDVEFTKNDKLAIYNFLGHCVFVYGQTVEKVETNPEQAIQASTSVPGTSSTTCTGPVPVRQQETKRGLLSVGGGCIGEIWKVSKRRKANSKLTPIQQEQAQNLYDMSFQMRMSSEEKKGGDVPIGLRIRDRGGLFLPKMSSLPFLRETNNIVMKYANKDSFCRYGKGMLKVCVAEVKNTVALWNLFRTASDIVIPHVPIDQRRMYFEEWLRKLTHARLAEFISAHTERQAEKAGRSSKGGQTLRDKLYALTSKRKTSKTKSAPTKKRTTKAKHATKPSATLKRKPCRAKRSLDLQPEVGPTPQPEEELPSTSESHTPKRKRVRTKHLEDFVE